MASSVEVKVQSPADLMNDNVRLVVPGYQRPYVWPTEDVLKLLTDVSNAAKREGPYYIGTLLAAVEGGGRPGPDMTLELIDGQQRITTLVLVALVLRKLEIDSFMGGFAVCDSRPRLDFAIRDKVRSLLGSWAGLRGYRAPKDAELNEDPYLIHLHGALTVLEQAIEAMGSKKARELGDYIYRNVRWVCNIVPAGVDLNRLFFTMNTSGIQLEQSDILKSLLLRNIKNNKAEYDAIWQVCEQMDNYFERNVRRVFSASDWDDIENEDLEVFESEWFVLPGAAKKFTVANVGTMTLAQITSQTQLHAGNMEYASEEVVGDKSLGDVVYCRSIISFPLLLLHAYRVFLKELGKEDIKVSLNSEHLIESFKWLVEQDGGKVRRFLECLWRVRYQFDKWVVKWLRSEGDREERLGLSRVRSRKVNSKWYLQREYVENSALTQLQSVCNFTGDRSAQYWISPFLGLLAQNEATTDRQVLSLLEGIDNKLSLATGTQKEASFALLGKEEIELENFCDKEKYLSQAYGTSFEHYWFQKLEYLLWKRWQKDDAKVRRYRVVSRNSVEHVHPRNEKYKSVMPDKLLHSFGNLALLNPGQNSSYSNKSVKVKKSEFESKGSYDALKLKHIFELVGSGTWTVEKVVKHRDEMLDIMREHYEV